MSDPHVVLVTGASGGVGRGIAQACGAAGWTVWIAARRAVEGQEVADEVTAHGGAGHFVQCDASRAADVQRAVATIIAPAASTSRRLFNTVASSM